MTPRSLEEELVQTFTNEELDLVLGVHPSLRALRASVPSTKVPPNEYIAAVVGAAERHGLRAELDRAARAERPYRPDLGARWDLVPVQQAPPGAHPLHRYPRGPRVPAHLLSLELIAAFSEQFPDGPRAMLAIGRANAVRVDADRDATLIGAGWLPEAGIVGMNAFWMKALEQGRLHGPRMLAALLQQLDADSLDAAQSAAFASVTAALLAKNAG